MDRLLEDCRRACDRLARNPLSGPARARLRRDKTLDALARRIESLLHTSGSVYSPETEEPAAEREVIKAVCWNIERGKHFEALARTMRSHPDLRDADLYFLTEVDWGMARSGNRNVAADLGRALGLHAYFAPSYFNLTAGHGSERRIDSPNEIGLHGKAILSRLPLENLRVSAMTNATDKFRSKEVRVGRKRSLLADLPRKNGPLALACVHLDAFSSPRMRARQFGEAVGSLLNGSSRQPALVAGDWNTNTIDTTSGRTMFLSVLRQLLRPGPRTMIREHHGHPQRRFERPLFRAIETLGLDYEGLNEDGAGTFDLVPHDRELGQMAKDQFPEWLLRWINRILERSGGRFSLKLDWFAGRGLRPLLKKVVSLRPGIDYPPEDRPSDHHPVLLEFTL